MSDKEYELSEDVIEVLEKMKQEIIEEMAMREWDRKKQKCRKRLFHKMSHCY